VPSPLHVFEISPIRLSAAQLKKYQTSMLKANQSFHWPSSICQKQPQTSCLRQRKQQSKVFTNHVQKSREIENRD